jgi:hypothetical protein
MSDEPLKVCPNCGAEIHRVLFATGVVFKGSGFYSTETRAQPGENGFSEAPAASSSGNGAKDMSTKSDAPATTAAASTFTPSSDSGSKASASKDSGKDSGKDS